MYETNWHYVDDEFSHCTVTPIKVLHEGILPGCTAVSITAENASGRVFIGSPDDYYKTEEEAWRAIRKGLLKTIESNDKCVETLKAETHRIFKYLCSLPEIQE
jgi:hypothetical protein